MKRFLLTSLMLVSLFARADVPMLSVSDEAEAVSIWPGAHFLVDEHQALKARDIAMQDPSPHEAINSAPILGFVSGQVWVWFTLQDLTKKPLQLQIQFPHLSHLSAYVFSSSGDLLHQVADISLAPHRTQSAPSQFLNVPLPKLKQALNSPVKVVLKIRSDHALRLPIEMGEQQAFTQNNLAQLGLVFISLGMLLALCLYNLVLFLSTARIYYLFYGLNLAFLQVFFLIDLGFTRYLFPQTHWLNAPSAWGISVCIAFIFAMLFAQSFLRLPQAHPKWNRWFSLLALGVALNMALAMFNIKDAALGLYLLLSVLYQVSIIVVSIQVLREGYQPARFFLLAWIFLAVGGMVYQLTITGLLPVNLLTEHAFLIGTVIEALLLSWALAELISKLQADQITNERLYQNILNKTSERLSRALKAADKHKKIRDVFLKNISHELKTPLHSIQHVLDLSMQGYQANSELIHDANHSSRLISRHIDKLLLNTEMGAYEPDFKVERLDVQPTLKTWHQDLSNECKIRGTNFSLNSNLVDWDVLSGPIRPVYLLLTEAIFNAATLEMDSIIVNFDVLQDKGHLHIHIDMHTTSLTPPVSTLELFQSSQDARFVNQLIGLLGGHWDVQFESSLILADIVIPNFSVSKNKNIEHLPKRVLVVEDNEINQKVMSSMLTRLGVHCELAINGHDALHKQAQSPFDIILMDCQMPVMDGFDTTLAMRANVRRYQHPIIIAVSANSMELDKTQCVAVGMNDFIAKPVRMDELRNVLVRWHNTKSKQDLFSA